MNGPHHLHYSEVSKVINPKVCRILVEVNRSRMERNKLIIRYSAQFTILVAYRKDLRVQTGS